MCGYESESWEHVLDRCAGRGELEDRGMCERVLELLNEDGRG